MVGHMTNPGPALALTFSSWNLEPHGVLVKWAGCLILTEDSRWQGSDLFCTQLCHEHSECSVNKWTNEWIRAHLPVPSPEIRLRNIWGISALHLNNGDKKGKKKRIGEIICCLPRQLSYCVQIQCVFMAPLQRRCQDITTKESCFLMYVCVHACVIALTDVGTSNYVAIAMSMADFH